MASRRRMRTRTAAAFAMPVLMSALMLALMLGGAAEAAPSPPPPAGPAYRVDGDCDAVTAAVVQYCRDYVVGQAPPSPGLNNPCCKTLRQNRARLGCLCGRVRFSSLNLKNLILTFTICIVARLPCIA